MGAENNTNDLFFNLDHRSASSATNLFAGYVDLRIDGAQRWFTFSGPGTELPEAPRSKTNYDFPETTKWQRGHVMTFNHVQKLDGRWSAFANVGSQNKSGYKYNSSAALRFDDAAAFVAANVGNAQNEATRNVYGQVGVRGNVQTGALSHDVAVAMDSARARYWNDTNNSPTGLFAGGLYSGVIHRPAFYPLPAVRARVPQWIETNTGVKVTDMLSYKKVDVLLAASMKHENFENQLTGQSIINDNLLPTYGITYKLSGLLSVWRSRLSAAADALLHESHECEGGG